jgi:predicted lipoprotein with Yx(FWY)xxD motif
MMDNPFRAIARKPFWVLSLCLPLLLVLAACGASANQAPPAAATSVPQATSVPAATEAPTVAEASSSSAEATINVVTDPNLGQILVDGNGMTLYMFTKDSPDQSTCSGKCFTSWPPLNTQGHPTLGAGVDASLIGNTKATDGTEMVTYNKMPLYHFFKDKNPGDTTGQGSNNVWYVVSPDGKAVGYNPPSGAATIAPTVVSTMTATTEATINVATDPNLGQILVDGNGMTLYMFTKDGPDQSTCSGKCFTSWPPLNTQGHPNLGAGVDASLIGNTKATDGTEMVTYNKMPLYYFFKDKKPGDTTGQGSNNVWYVVSPDGKAVGYNP